MIKACVEMYNGVKYEEGTEVIATANYKDVVAFEVKSFSDAEIYDQGFDEVDPYKEYLIITFENGETATFKNSFTDLFIISRGL